MSDTWSDTWSDGYVADLAYTHGYYRELNPRHAALACLLAGQRPPAFSHACELGFGQGLSLAIHASAGGLRWSGTDFNPEQARHAQDLLQAAGVSAALYDDSFADFASRDRPGFDFIGLHGVWSWISDDNRRTLVTFLHRALRPGGLLYISYNTQPGWAGSVPLRELLTDHVRTFGAPGQPLASRIDAALAFAERLLATAPAHAKHNPQFAQRLRQMQSLNRAYLAHEYFNRDWAPMSIQRLAEWLAPAKLSYLGPAHLLDRVDGLNLSPEQQQLLADQPDALFREGLRDHCMNQQFRRDLWIKGRAPLNALEQRDALRAARLVLVRPRGEVALTVSGSRGEVALQQSIYAPLLDALSDHRPRTLGELETALGASFAQLREALTVLVGSGAVQPAQDEATIAQCQAPSARLNRTLLEQARGRSDRHSLASPVTGGGIAADRFQQLFLLARHQGHTQPSDWAGFAWEQLAAQGECLVKDGQPLADPEANRAELTRRAEAFAGTALPVLDALGAS